MAAVEASPRCRLFFLAVIGAFVLGAFWWAANALWIAAAVDRCLAVEGSVWDDIECRLSIKYSTIVAVVSLILMLALLRRELKAEAEAQIIGEEAAAGAHDALPDPELQALALGPERRHLRGSDAAAKIAIYFICIYCIVLFLVGMVFRLHGAGLLVDYPGDKGALALLRFGSILENVGILAFALENCCLIVPYLMLRLRRFLREKVGGSVSA